MQGDVFCSRRLLTFRRVHGDTPHQLQHINITFISPVNLALFCNCAKARDSLCRMTHTFQVSVVLEVKVRKPITVHTRGCWDEHKEKKRWTHKHKLIYVCVCVCVWETTHLIRTHLKLSLSLSLYLCAWVEMGRTRKTAPRSSRPNPFNREATVEISTMWWQPSSIRLHPQAGGTCTGTSWTVIASWSFSVMSGGQMIDWNCSPATI